MRQSSFLFWPFPCIIRVIKGWDSLKETDLYMPVKTYFEDRGFLVRSEVRDIDVVAVKENLLVGIELKKGLTVELLIQGTLRQKTCDLVYLAVPKPKRVVKDRTFMNLLYMLKRLELGLLYVDVEKGEAVEVLEPSLYDLQKGKRSSLKEKVRILKETEKRSVDGNKGGSRGKKLLTAYREDALRAAALIRVKGHISPKDLKERGLKRTLLSKNYYQWFEKVGHGKYTLKSLDAVEKSYESLLLGFMMEYEKEDSLQKEPVEMDS